MVGEVESVTAMGTRPLAVRARKCSPRGWIIIAADRPPVTEPGELDI